MIGRTSYVWQKIVRGPVFALPILVLGSLLAGTKFAMTEQLISCIGMNGNFYDITETALQSL